MKLCMNFMSGQLYIHIIVNLEEIETLSNTGLQEKKSHKNIHLDIDAKVCGYILPLNFCLM